MVCADLAIVTRVSIKPPLSAAAAQKIRRLLLNLSPLYRPLYSQDSLGPSKPIQIQFAFDLF